MSLPSRLARLLILAFAILGVARVPLGERTALERGRRIWAEPSVRRVAEEVWGGASGLARELGTVASQLGGATRNDPPTTGARPPTTAARREAAPPPKP